MFFISELCKKRVACSFAARNNRNSAGAKLFWRKCSQIILVLSIYFASIANGKVWSKTNGLSSLFHEDLANAPSSHLDLQFLTNVRGPSLHSDNDYHIVNVTYQDGRRTSSYTIHLSRSEGLVHTEIIGNSEYSRTSEETRCIYSGTITEQPHDHWRDPRVGVVSFSSCHHETGFEGLILLPHEQLYIHPSIPSPHFQHLSKRSTQSQGLPDGETLNKPTIPHKAYKVSHLTSPQTGQTVDVVRTPPAELLKEARKNPSSLDHLDDEEDQDPEEAFLGPKKELEGTADTLEGTALLENNDEGLKEPLSPVMLALSKGNRGRSKNLKNRGKTKPSSKKPSKSPASSSSSTTRVVEIAVFTDESLHKLWKSRSPANPKTKIKDYVLAILNNMNALYKQPSMTEKVDFRLVNLEIQTTRPREMKEYNGHATKYLTSFCNYAAGRNPDNDLWDHALLLTGLDLQENGANTTAGLAWFSAMCLKGLSCSVIEAYNFNAAFITTHEIAHSLGMDHDGAGQNAKCDPNSYIMSPTTGGGKTDWSKCSTQNMRNFISNGYMGNPVPKCISKKGARASNAIKFASSKLPGQQFDANFQCAVECKGCTPHISPPYDNICYLLYCKPPTTSIIFSVYGTHPALEGTTCATGKVCRLGKCI